jgi:hypothetical protein
MQGARALLRLHDGCEMRTQRIVRAVREIGIAETAEGPPAHVPAADRSPKGRKPLLDETPTTRELDDRQHRRRRALDLRIAVGEQQRARALRVPRDEPLRNRTGRIADNDVHRLDAQLIEQADEHLHLRLRRERLPGRRHRLTHAEKIRRDAQPSRREQFHHAAPPEAVEREPMQQQCGAADTVREERDLAVARARDSAPPCDPAPAAARGRAAATRGAWQPEQLRRRGLHGDLDHFSAIHGPPFKLRCMGPLSIL